MLIAVFHSSYKFDPWFVSGIILISTYNYYATESYDVKKFQMECRYRLAVNFRYAKLYQSLLGMRQGLMETKNYNQVFISISRHHDV